MFPYIVEEEVATAGGRVVKLYQDWGKPQQAAEWRALLNTRKAARVRARPRNLGFEEASEGEAPPGWSVPVLGYVAETRHEGCKAGSGCAVLLPPATQTAPFGNIMQTFNAEQFRGKNVRFRAWIRVENTDTGGHAQMWVRVDRPHLPGLFDNMADRPINSSEWANYAISGDVASDALSINIGVMSYGRARVWVDDVTFEIVDTPPRP